MAYEIVFYSLAPKPPSGGRAVYAAAVSGKVSRGRKWFRLEASPASTVLLSDLDQLDHVIQRLRPAPCCYLLDGEFYRLDNGLEHGAAARDYAIDQFYRHNPGWVVFLEGV